MTRAIDHLVVASREPDAQAALYRRLGFQVGARNRHPWGTENHIVQFENSFLELISLGADFR
jgi:Glyoxalase-like domain